MKLKIKELNANPFKKEINAGELSEEQIKKIMSNMKELGLMGSLPVFKKDNKYYLVNGHHRIEALKRKFGKNFEVEVVVHNYNTSQTLRGMVIENLSQRGNDFREEIPNVLAVKRFLMQTVRTADSSKQTHKSEVGSREIAEWINGEVKDSVISKTRVCELTRVDKFIPKDIIETATHKQGSIVDTKKLRYDQLVSLSKLEDKKEAKEVAKALVNSENQRVNDHRKFVKEYKEAPEEIKQKVKKGEIDISDIRAVKLSTKKDIGIKTEIEELKDRVKSLNNKLALFKTEPYLTRLSNAQKSIVLSELKFHIEHYVYPVVEKLGGIKQLRRR